MYDNDEKEDSVEKFNDDVIGKIEELVRVRNTFWKREIEDLDISRSMSSGFGFDEDDEQYYGEIKQQVTVNLLRSWVDQVVTSYDQNPFAIGLSSYTKDISAEKLVLEDIQNQNDITDIASELLRAMLNDGYGYLLVTNEVVDEDNNYQTPKLKVLDSRKVIVDDCEEADLSDCDIAIVVDVLKKRKAAKKYGIDEYDLRSDDLLSGMDVLLDSETECSVITAYEMVDDGVRVSKIVHHKVVDQTVLPLTRIPIVRFFGEVAYINKEKHWRGTYHYVQDLLKAINYTASETQSRVALAEQANWIGDPKGRAGNEKDWEQGSVSLFKGYNGWDGDKEVMPPIPVSKQLFTGELVQTMDSFVTLTASILGKPNTEGTAGDTAEAVLARKAVGEASTNRYLKNLKKCLKSTGRVLLDFMSVLYDVPRTTIEGEIPSVGDVRGISVEVDAGPLESGQKHKNLQQLIAMNQIAVAGQVAGATQKMMPVFIHSMDLPEDQKKYLLQQFTAPAIPPEVQAQMQQMQQALQAKDAELQQLNTYILGQEKKIQADLFKNAQNNQHDKEMKLMDIEGKMVLEGVQQEGEMDKLNTQLIDKASADVLKVKADFAKASMQLNKSANQNTIPFPLGQ